ncbi:MAG: peptide chain release factor N(5)-glutamine methyltransferase [Burkholderiaceae bacterium]|nr:peptide chain release factor N(5)-glutamine methyltransferase [Burkholderiaceae bacterium]
MHPQATDPSTAQVGALLAACNLPLAESRAILAHALGVARERLIAHPGDRVAPSAIDSFVASVKRRQGGEPLGYLLGEKEFYGRAFVVSRAVLIPRPETELLVQRALACTANDEAAVLELGTGSGCVAITLALERPNWQLTATDVSAVALEVAQINADRWQTTHVALRAGSWFNAVPHDARFDLIVSNPPYVAEDDPHLHALRFEPSVALASDGDGMSALQTIIESALAHLVPNGHLALEHGYQQGRAVRNLFGARQWHEVHTVRDLAGLERITTARLGCV